MKPLVRGEFKTNSNPVATQYLKDSGAEEVWLNDIYQVNVRRNVPCTGINQSDGSPALITHLSIKRRDRSAKVDWRDFQYIKNQLVGEENEGCEIFPAESRLVDGANSYHLWIFQDTSIRLPFGFNERIVSERSFLGEVQRPFPYNRKPSDLKESEEKLEKLFTEYQKNIE